MFLYEFQNISRQKLFVLLVEIPSFRKATLIQNCCTTFFALLDRNRRIPESPWPGEGRQAGLAHFAGRTQT